MTYHKDTKDTKDTKQRAVEDLPPEVNRFAHAVIGAAIEVHKVLGPGYRENIYEDALCIELGLRRLPYLRQPSIVLNYKGHVVGEGRLDLLVGDCLIVELKAVDQLGPVHQAQVLSYLKATDYRLGLLINFNVENLGKGVKRIIY